MLYLIPAIAQRRMKKTFAGDMQKLAAGEHLDYFEYILKSPFAARSRVSELQAFNFLEDMCRQYGGTNVGSPEQGIEDYAFDFSGVAAAVVQALKQES